MRILCRINILAANYLPPKTRILMTLLNYDKKIPDIFQCPEPFSSFGCKKLFGDRDPYFAAVVSGIHYTCRIGFYIHFIGRLIF